MDTKKWGTRGFIPDPFSLNNPILNHHLYPYLFLISALLFLQLNVSAGGEKISEPDGECINCIYIQGSSNINQFRLVNLNPHIKPSTDPPRKNNVAQNILIPVHDFTGPNNRLLNDFYQMVNASHYPFIKISLEPVPAVRFDEIQKTAWLTTGISIAGVTHHYSVPCQMMIDENTGLIVKGNLKIKLSDFNITPPEKVFGAVKVNNEVFINFAFQLNPETILTEKMKQ